MKRIGLVFERSVKNNEIQRFRNPQFNAMSLDRRSFLAATAAGASSLLSLPAFAAAPRGFGELRQIDAGFLNIGHADLGPRDGPPVLLLHGWPYDIHTYEEVAPLLAAQGYRVVVPYLRGYGSTRFLSDATPRNAQQTAIAADAIALLDALGIPQATVAGCDWGARTACVMAALWPQRVKALVSVSGYLVANVKAGPQPLAPSDELAWWYQFYLATDRGRAGYEKNHRDFARLIWRQASPEWRFDDATFERSAPAFDNPDHVAITVHNYRWRLGLAEGEARYEALEARLATVPSLAMPAITLEGDANGAPHPRAAAYAGRFTGRYEHRELKGGIGHNLPQEAPAAFAQAVIDASRG
jgi:pimeloyl-ACP methyl ester carboxylesterase